MRQFLFALSLVITTHIHAQNNPFNSPEWWGRLSYESTPMIANTTDIDTSIIVVTNRYKTKDELRFMSEDTGDGALMYFYVYAQGGLWHVLALKSLKEAIGLTPNKNNDWVVYTEGMGKIFTSELNRGMMMSAQYKVNVIMLDYPSITTTKSMLGNYRFSITNSRLAYKYHLPTLQTIKQCKQSGVLGNKSLNLFFHSMGNNLLKELVTNEQLSTLNDNKWVDNIILNAACVASNDHASWLSKVWFGKRIFLQYNPEDRVLKGASLAAFTSQLGCKPEYPLAIGAHYVNFHSLVADGHSYFLTLQGRTPVLPKVWHYYNTILHGSAIDFTASDYQQSSFDKIGYELVPN